MIELSSDPAGALSFDLDDEGVSRWTWDVASGGVTWSRGIDALFGLPPGGFGGTYAAYLALVHPDDRSYFQAIIARTLDGDAEYVMSHRVLWPDGSVHWIFGRGRLTRDEAGRPTRLDGVSWDEAAKSRSDAQMEHLRRAQTVTRAVTKELLRVQSEAEAFERACRIAVDHGHFRFAWVAREEPGTARVVAAARAGHEDGYLDDIRITTDGTVAGSGPAGTAFRTGATMVVNDIATDPVFRPWRDKALQRGYRGCAAFPLRRDRVVVGVLIVYAAEPHHFHGLQLDLFEGLAEDIGFTLDVLAEAGRRREAEAALRSSEESLRVLFEQAADAIFIVEVNGRVLDANPAAAEMTGYAGAELRSMSLSEIVRAPGRARLSDAPPRTVEQRLRRKDGSWLDVEIGASGRPDGRIQAYVRDVTPRKQLQQRLILADRLASLGRLAAGVAHEVNNPLAYLTLNLEAIERRLEVSGARDATLQAAIHDARDGAERVRAVVRALGALGRDDEAHVDHLEIDRVLDTAIRLADNRTRHRGRITKSYEATRGVRANELRLAQVFVNLLVNAADALRDDAVDDNEIHVRTLDDNGDVVVEIRDNGVGIAREDLGRVFDPFFTTKPVGEGTGLGLSISHSIVASFGGALTVESTVGAGSTFRVRLRAQSADGTPSEQRPPSQAPKPARARLLIIDDEPRLAAVLASSLDTHDVTVATSGKEGLAACATVDFDCILCDLMMPGVSGSDLHAELARTRPGLELRVIFMTGGAFTARARDFVASVPNPVLEKPFSADCAERMIESVLAARRR